MLKGFNENGELKDIKVTENGAVMVSVEGGGETQSTVVSNTSENPVPVNIQNQSVVVGNTSSNAVPVDIQNANISIGNTSANAIPVNVQNASTIVGNTAQNPVPVNITNTSEVETILNVSVQTLGTTETTIAINKKVTSIDIANYSETASITIGIGAAQYVIGNNIAVTLPINSNVGNLTLSATEANTKAQIVVKGVN